MRGICISFRSGKIQQQTWTFLTIIKKIQEDFKFEFDLKKEQEEIIDSILKKQHTFGILPTGFGKSLTFIVPPLLLDISIPSVRHHTIVICPLVALMKDQCSSLQRRGVSATYISQRCDMDDATVEGMSNTIMFIMSRYYIIMVIPQKPFWFKETWSQGYNCFINLRIWLGQCDRLILSINQHGWVWFWDFRNIFQNPALCCILDYSFYMSNGKVCRLHVYIYWQNAILNLKRGSFEPIEHPIRHKWPGP